MAVVVADPGVGHAVVNFLCIFVFLAFFGFVFTVFMICFMFVNEV